MTELDAMIEKSSTEAAIEAALEKVCALLPASVRSMCDGVVEVCVAPVIISSRRPVLASVRP